MTIEQGSLAEAVLAIITVTLLVAGGAMLALGAWEHELLAFALGVTFVTGALLTRPT